MRRATAISVAAVAIVLPFVLVLVARYARRPSEAECHAQAEAFRAWSERLPKLFFTDSKIAPLLATVPPAQPRSSIQRRPFLVIWPGRVELDGTPVAGTPGLRMGLQEKEKAIRQSMELFGGTGAGFEGFINVAITRDTRWSDVVEILTVVRQEQFQNVSFIFARPGPPPPVISDFNQAWVDRLKDPGSLLTRALEKQPEVLTAITPRCSAIGIILQREADSRHYDKIQTLWSRHEDCECVPDVEVLKAWEAHWVPPGGFAWSVFVGGFADVGDDPKLPKIGYPADARWEQIAEQFMKAIETEDGGAPAVRLEVKP